MVELSTTSFEAFCDDIAGMFQMEMKCSMKGESVETTKSLSQKFKKLAAVTFVKTNGVLNGTFHIIFDQGGLFTLAGLIVMLPKQRILDDRKRGSLQDAEAIADTVKETGNLLVGSWDRIFREEMEGHGHFIQSNTFIGNPWGNPKEKIGLEAEEKLSLLHYEITADGYPPFECGVIFSDAIFVEPPAPPPVEAVATEVKQEEKPAEVKPAEAAAAVAEPVKTEVAAEAKSAEVKPVETVAAAQKPAKTEPVAEVKSEAKPAEVKTEEAKPAEVKPVEKEAVKTQAAAEVKPADVSKPINDKEPAAGPISETIQKMVQTTVSVSGDGLISLKMCAKDVMQTNVLWGSPDDSVELAMTKMQRADTSYMMVGKDGLPEGIVSTFDLAAALSIYLKPMFAKWRRPTDDATLQIRVRWIMTRPVRTIKPDTSLTAVMENMCQSGLRCLPVTEKDGKIAGLITVFDIFRVLLNNTNHSVAGNTLQAASIA